MSKRIFYPLFILIIPIIGMLYTEEVNWGLLDFIIMGSLLIILGTGINFVLNRTTKLKNRILYIGILILFFLFIWIELSVGIIGSPFAGS